MSYYISLGSDCSVSWNLRRLGLQTRGTMPFDWMRIDKLQDVISILDAGFNEFARIDSYTIKGQVLAFDYFDSDTKEGKPIKSECKMLHTKYKFTLPHEYQGTQLDSREFQEKYSRRICRFLEIGRNSKMHKVFVRLGQSKELNALVNLEITLDKLGIVNYEIKFISLEDWEDAIPKDKPFQWQREYIPWEKILILQ
jgi:Putative papain-like cysteine peptidase (DUF1796)